MYTRTGTPKNDNIRALRRALCARGLDLPLNDVARAALELEHGDAARDDAREALGRRAEKVAHLRVVHVLVPGAGRDDPEALPEEERVRDGALEDVERGLARGLAQEVRERVVGDWVRISKSGRQRVRVGGDAQQQTRKPS